MGPPRVHCFLRSGWLNGKGENGHRRRYNSMASAALRDTRAFGAPLIRLLSSILQAVGFEDGSTPALAARRLNGGDASPDERRPHPCGWLSRRASFRIECE